MSNNWNIPKDLEDRIRQRDLCCVYCGVRFLEKPASVKESPSWEHIVNDASIITFENIAMCCRACNSSKGAKKLKDWLNSKYCLSKNINFKTVAPVVRSHLK